MRKPANIILTLVGTAVAGGVGLSALNRRTHWDNKAQHGASAALPAEQVILEKEYETDSYVQGVGYYHAPYSAWFPHRYNFSDASRGYFHGGSWTPDAHVSSVTRSLPTLAALALAREAYRKANPLAGRSSSSRSSGFRFFGGSFFGGGGSHGKGTFSSSSSSSGGSRSSGTSHGGFGGSSHSSSS